MIPTNQKKKKTVSESSPTRFTVTSNKEESIASRVCKRKRK